MLIKNDFIFLYITTLLPIYCSINSTIELPIIIPSENFPIFLAVIPFFIPKPTVTGMLPFDSFLIWSTLFLIGLKSIIDDPVIPFIET